MSQQTPTLKILINNWTLWNETSTDGTIWSLDQRLRAVRDAGFDAYCCAADEPGLKAGLEKYGLRFGGAFDAGSIDRFAPAIQAALAIDNGPINCQLADHDTPVEKSIELTIALMEESERQGADVHLEMHRDTCTETPEKAYAIAEGFKKAKGYYPKINFDFSHPASIKHLGPENYVDRLFENIPLFQQSTLWHMRPFNGHHCQVPVTDGQGSFSPEYKDMQPFIQQALRHWLDGPRPNNELWLVPELGPKFGYGLSCFPPSWPDAIVLANDIKRIWQEEVQK